MIGFTGTVAGMVKAFDAIAAANDISPAVVAGGISQALLTTAFGLIVAMIIQVFQNFFVSRIDKLVLDMEEQSVRLIDHLYDLDAEDSKPQKDKKEMVEKKKPDPRQTIISGRTKGQAKASKGRKKKL
jgi:hypothetical protein